MSRSISIVGRPVHLDVAETDLGWVAIWGAGRVLQGVVFGQRTASAAKAAAERKVAGRLAQKHWHPELVDRLVAYAAGVPDDFANIEIDLSHLTEFSARVVRQCRRIRYGQTSSYGRLAAAAGSPGAARAVGTVMSGNRYPLVVPCHRVLNANGSLGNYSGPEGTRMKCRLLEMEQQPIGLAF